VSEWAAILTSIGALITAAGLFYAAWNARRKNQTDATLAITQAAENIVSMREKQIAELEAKIRDREADVTMLRDKVLDRDRGLEALNAKLEARENDLRELRIKLQNLYRYVEYLHKFIVSKSRKKPASLEEYLRQEAVAKTHFENGFGK
jgi:chromosome segregation ATPase